MSQAIDRDSTACTADAAKTLKILIADDTFASRQLLARLLRQFLRTTIHEASDGVQAVQEFRVSRPDITFLDIDMPNMDGMAALKEIRTLEPESFVVMVSGVSSIETVQQAQSLGVNGFVVKPYSGQRIFDVMKKYALLHGGLSLLRGN